MENKHPLIGQEVKFLAGGKVSRLDGVAGQWVKGVVLSVENRVARIQKSYTSMVPFASVELKNVQAIQK